MGASTGLRVSKQRIVSVSGTKVTIKSTNRTLQGTPIGFFVIINNKRYFSNLLDRQEAEEQALAKWKQKQ